MTAEERVKQGERPTQLLREALREHPEWSNAKLAENFVLKFPNIKELSVRVAIWNWRRPDGLRARGLDDTALDEILNGYLSRAGYLG